jgi:YhcH/YjgK/YiaL family protein
MVLDSLDNGARYRSLHPSLARAFEWLEAYDPITPDGRYEIGGPNLIAIVQRYETAPDALKKWETHRLHGDVQFMVSGSELVGYAQREVLSIRTPYNAEKDAEFYEPPVGAVSRFNLHAGSFAIFLPEDAHQPGVMDGNPGEVHKVVIKFRL